MAAQRSEFSSARHDKPTNEVEDDECSILTAEEVAEWNTQRDRQTEILGPGWRSQTMAMLLNSDTVQADVTVECRGGSFFLIKKIMSKNEKVMLLGHKLVRSSAIEGHRLRRFLPAKRNELCIIIPKVEKGQSTRINDDHCFEYMPLHDAIQVREVVFTNRPFGELRDCRILDEAYTLQHGRLVCRWKYIEEIELVGGQLKLGAIKVLALREEECTPNLGISDVLKSMQFLRKTIKSPVNNKQGRKRGTDNTIDLTDDSDGETCQSKKRKMTDYFPAQKATNSSLRECARVQKVYTYGDVCCGAGGNAEGAKNAGYKVKWGIDSWDKAYLTFVLNHPSATAHLENVTKFCNLIRGLSDEQLKALQTDVLHLSLPCQGHSHLNQGTNPERDAENNALIFAIGPLVHALKPRRVTMEQTNHILTKNEGNYFRSIVDQLTTLGYSVGYKVLNAIEYGVPSKRKRLIVLASSPGETLPSFPEPTHGFFSSGLKPFVTLNNALLTISRDSSLHDVRAERGAHARSPFQGIPAEGNAPLSRIVICGGISGLLHPNGERRFTLRELATIQGFDQTYDFAAERRCDILKLIGNAVPPALATAILSKVRESLILDDAANAAYISPVIKID